MSEGNKPKVDNPNIGETFRLDVKIIESEKFERLSNIATRIEEELQKRYTKFKNQKSKLEENKENHESKVENEIKNEININDIKQDNQNNQGNQFNIIKQTITNNNFKNINNGRSNVPPTLPENDSIKTISKLTSERDIFKEKKIEQTMDKKESTKLKYSKIIFFIILFLNCVLPGIGTIIAGIGWGNSQNSKNRVKELILRGIMQLLTFIFLVGWIQAINDACNYFEIEHK